MANRANPNSAIAYLSVLLIILLSSVAYAVFSDSLMISGTASAKGTFDLEFQNATVVLAETEGIDEINTTAVISDDKNTLTVNVADISYPGAGATFSVDIANVGTIPAKVKSVIQTNIKGSGLAKITGLEQIGIDRPSIEAKEKYNLKFRVEWDPEITDEEYINNLLATEGDTVSFKLEIEYEQKTELFDGKASHDDVEQERPPILSGNPNPTYDVPTNLTGLIGQTLSEVRLPKGFSWNDPGNTVLTTLGMNIFEATYTPDDTENYAIVNDIDLLVMVYEKEGILAQTITPGDYGKNINYNVTVNGVLLNNWRVFYNDGKNVQIIYGDYLPNALVPEETGLTPVAKTKYNVNSSTRDKLINGLQTNTYWSEFAAITGSTAMGCPTYETITASFEQKYGISWNSNIAQTDSTGVYVPHNVSYDDCNSYWLASLYPGPDQYMYYVTYRGYLTYHHYTNIDVGVRPVITLPASATGRIGNSVVMDVEKVMPQYTVPEGLKANAGEVLSNIELPEGFTWNNPSESVGNIVGIKSFKATFTPENTVIYQTVKDIDINVEIIKSGTLSEILDGSDYGKLIDYTVEVNGKSYRWKILYSDSTKVQLIMADYLPQEDIPQTVLNNGLEKITEEGYTTYNVYSSVSRDILVNALTTGWDEFSNGLSGSEAVGAASKEIIEASFKTKYGKEWDQAIAIKDELYIPHPQDYNGASGYWLITPYTENNNNESQYYVFDRGMIIYNYYNNKYCAVRPVVTIPGNTSATIGDTVTLDKKRIPAYTVPSGLKATYGQTLSDVTLPQGFTWQDALNTSVGNVGTNIFSVKYTPVDTINYDEVPNLKLVLTVEKANPEVPEVIGLKAVVGDTLADVTLPEGFEWQEELTTSVGEAGLRKHKVIYTPADTEHYNIVKDIEVTIGVEKRTGKLAEIINGSDYGKAIDYSVEVNGIVYNDWEILYNDKTNVQIIMNDFLPHAGIPEEALNAGLQKVTSMGETPYNVYSDVSQGSLISGLTTGWDVFASGIGGEKAAGATTKDVLESSFKEKYGKNWDNSKAAEDSLYVTHGFDYYGCSGCWLNSPYDSADLWCLNAKRFFFL